MCDQFQRDDWQERILNSYHECCSPKLDHVANPLTSLALQGIKCQILPHSGHQYWLLYPTVAVSNQRGNYKLLTAGMTIQPEIRKTRNDKTTLITSVLCIININTVWTHIDHHTHTDTHIHPHTPCPAALCWRLYPTAAPRNPSYWSLQTAKVPISLPAIQCFNNNKNPSLKRNKK